MPRSNKKPYVNYDNVSVRVISYLTLLIQHLHKLAVHYLG